MVSVVFDSGKFGSRRVSREEIGPPKGQGMLVWGLRLRVSSVFHPLDIASKRVLSEPATNTVPVLCAPTVADMREKAMAARRPSVEQTLSFSSHLRVTEESPEAV